MIIISWFLKKLNSKICNNYHNKMKSPTFILILLRFAILNVLLIEVHLKRQYYYPISFKNHRIEHQLTLKDEPLTVNLQFSEKFTTTLVQYVSQEADGTTYTWTDMITFQPYVQTKFYSNQTKIHVICQPTQKNPKNTITLNYQFGGQRVQKYFNFIGDSQPQFFSAFEAQVITSCSSTWSGWSIGLMYQNGTQLTEQNDQPPIFCTKGSYAPQVVNQFYLKQNEKVYPYLYRYNRLQTFPSDHAFYMTFYLESRRYCGGNETYNRTNNRTNCTYNQTCCQCGFIWINQTGRCQRDCQFLNYTLGIQDNSTTQCICPQGEIWNQNEIKCQQMPFLTHWWGITILTVSIVTLVTLIVISGVIVKKVLLRKKRISPFQIQEETGQQKFTVQSMRIIDFYQ